MKIAYLSNLFPAPVEPYVWEEIEELRRRGIEIIPCSARRPRPSLSPELQEWAEQTLYLVPPRPSTVLQALRLCRHRNREFKKVVGQLLLERGESCWRRAKAVAHAILGACFAVQLKPTGAQHIHVHHGYFSSCMAMVAARLLGIPYTMTLHGSDLLRNHAFLNTKLANCAAVFTVSEHNQQFIYKQYPQAAGKVILRRMGTEILSAAPPAWDRLAEPFILLTAGRLHPVKNHVFLVEACAMLKQRRVRFVCLIAGDGPERGRLRRQIKALDLQEEVKLLGHLRHAALLRILHAADLFVLTSESEGIPLALMEAMAAGRPVLAPAITGIPELVLDGETGFLYRPGSLHDFVARVELIRKSVHELGPVREAARHHVQIHFNRSANLQTFADQLLAILPREQVRNEDPVLQQVQLSF